MPKFSKQTLTSKTALFVLSVLLIFLANIKFKQYQSEKQIEALTQNIKTQVAQVQKNSDDLNKSFAYLTSSDFKERVARQDMNYKKEGEQVYGFTQNLNTKEQDPAANNKSSNNNAIKWWNYFFTAK